MKQTLTFQEAQVLSIFEDVYLNMIESGAWFNEDNEPIESVQEGNWTEDQNEYNWAMQFVSSYRFFQANKEALEGFEINEVNDYIDKADTIMEVVFEKIVRDQFADELAAGQEFEEVADGIDFWEDKNGQVLIEGNGMKPLDGVRKIGHVQNGVFWVR